MAQDLCAATRGERTCATDARRGGKRNWPAPRRADPDARAGDRPKKISRHTLRNARERYAEIEAMKGEHAIRWLCQLWGVAPSGYYRWRHHRPNERQREDAVIAAQIAAAHEASR